jgi:hypothetical protein
MRTSNWIAVNVITAVAFFLAGNAYQKAGEINIKLYDSTSEVSVLSCWSSVNDFSRSVECKP